MALERSDYRARVYGGGTKGILNVATRAPSARTLADEKKVYRHSLSAHLPASKDARIFEIGAGAGALVAYLREAGYAGVEALEQSADCVAQAKALGVEGVSEGDAIAHLAGAAAQYDCVIALDVLEHFRKDEIFGVVDTIFGALKPGGRLIWRAPNADGPFFGRVFFGDLTHEQPYTRHTAFQLMTLCGFTNVRVLADPPFVTGARSLLRWLLWKALSPLARLYLFAESYATGALLTTNLLVVADKPAA